MDKIEPAFGHFVPDGHYNGSMHFEGLTKREWFAGMALQGLLSGKIQENVSNKLIAKTCIQMADDILEELSK